MLHRVIDWVFKTSGTTRLKQHHIPEGFNPHPTKWYLSIWVTDDVMKYSFIHSIAMCRMWRFLAVLRCSIPLCYVHFPATLLHQLFFHPLSPHLTIYFLLYLSILLFPNSYIIPFWGFYFLPFCVHAKTNVIYLNLMSLEMKWTMKFEAYCLYYSRFFFNTCCYI